MKAINEKEYPRMRIITLCGSTKFKDEFIKQQKRLTLEGYIVISVGLFGHSGDNEVCTGDTKIMLDAMHKQKIDLADEIFVINVGGYIGSSTNSEIEYAISQKKTINYLEAQLSNTYKKALTEASKGTVTSQSKVLSNASLPKPKMKISIEDKIEWLMETLKYNPRCVSCINHPNIKICATRCADKSFYNKETAEKIVKHILELEEKE